MNAVDLQDKIENEGGVRQALKKLDHLDGRKACIARMRLVGKLSVGQIALVLGLEQPTVAREWGFTRAWLAREVGDRRA